MCLFCVLCHINTWLCRAVVELCPTIWTNTKLCVIYWSYSSDRATQNDTSPKATLTLSLRDAGVHSRKRLVSYAVCYSSPTTYGRVRFLFSIFCSYLVRFAYDRRPQLLYMYTLKQILTPSVISSLLSKALPRVTRTDLSQRHFCFQPPICLIRVHVIRYIICIEKRFRGIYPWGLGLGNSEQDVHGHIAAIESYSSPKGKVYS